jgi:putative DNA primase/helicase
MAKKKAPPGTFEPFNPNADSMAATIATASNDDWSFPYKMFADGLYLLNEDGEKEGMVIAPPFDVMGRSRDGAGNNWGLVIRFCDPDGREKTIIIPRADLVGDRWEALTMLASAGLHFPPGNGRRLKTALAGLKPTGRVTLVDQSGWVTPGGDYVLGNIAIVRPPTDGTRAPLYHRTGDTPPLLVTGTLEGWREHVSLPCIGNSRLVIALCVAFTGPLLALIGADGFGLHLRGISSSGKSTALIAASSVAGVGVGTWRATGNGLESTASIANDGLLILDELAEVSAFEAAPVVYMLGNGQGKARANRIGEAGKRKTWRVAMLSSGEISLAQKIAESNPRATSKAGQEVRLIDIEADAGKGFGLFETMPGGIKPGDFSDSLKASAKAYSGHAMRPFIEALQSDQGQRARALHAQIHKAFASQWPDIDGQASRVRDRFAMIATAGEYASEIGVTGWPAGEATKAAKICFSAWQTPRAVGNHESRTAIEAVRTFIQVHANRFQSGNDDAESRLPHMAGCIREIHGVRHYCFFSGPWKIEVMAGQDSRAGLRCFKTAGLLTTDKDKAFTYKTRANSTMQNVYAVKATILEGDDE